MTRHTAVKALGEGRIGGYLVVFGNPAQKDLQGEYFTPDTNFELDWYKQRPVLFHHGLDGEVKTSVVGVIDSLKMDNVGIWAEATINMAKKYAKKLLEMIEQGILHWSSGSLPHLVEVAMDGRLKRWPIVEGSLTPTPAEPRRTNIRKIKAAFEEAGIAFDILATKGDDDPAPDPVAEPEPPAPENVSEPSEPASSDPEGQTPKEEAPAQLPEADHSDEQPNNDNEPLPEPEPEPVVTNDSESPSGANKGDFTMEDQLTQFVGFTAQALGVELNDAGIKTVADNIKTSICAKTGADELTVPQLKLALADNSFKAQIAEWVSENADGADMRSLADTFVGSMKGMGGTPKHQLADNPLSTPGGGGTPMYIADRGRKMAFDKMDVEDKSFYYDMAKMVAHVRGKSWTPPEWFLESFSEGLQDTIDEIGAYMITDNEENRTVHDIPTAVKAMEHIAAAKHKGMKSNELNYSTQAGYGDEWVATLWQPRLWALMQQESVVASMFQTIDMPSNPFTIPLEGDDPTVYSASEATDDADITTTGPVTASKVATANTSITAYKMGVRSPWSGEFNEDAIIQFIPNIRSKQLRAMMNAIDFNLLNADTTNSTVNIAYYGASQPTGARWLLGFDGINHRALVDSPTTLLFNAGGTIPTLQMFREAQGGLNEYFLDQEQDLVWLVTPKVRHVIKSVDKLLEAGVQTGNIRNQIGEIDGIPVVSTHQQKDGTAAGYIHSTASNNVAGRASLVYRPHFLVGYRRRIQTWVKYMEQNDTYQMGGWVRVGFIRRDTNREASVMMRNIGL